MSPITLPSPHNLPPTPDIPAALRAKLEADYERLPVEADQRGLTKYVRETYQIDLSTTYAGLPIANPWGKASGQLSMNLRQVQEDIEAGLGFVVLKTVIAQDESGVQSMHAWAIKEQRMFVEPIQGTRGDTGWTVSWKGRGWWQSFDDYLTLVREARSAAAHSGTLIVPSCKFHLPGDADETPRAAEYQYTIEQLLRAWNHSAATPQLAMPLEKDFSPTLAGSDSARMQERILEWLRVVPPLIRTATAVAAARSDPAAAPSIRLGLKLFNALFDDDFQLQMLRTIHDRRGSPPDYFVYGNRLFDPQRLFDGHRGIAYGGPDLSDRNLRVMTRFCQMMQPAGEGSLLEWSGTGNIDSGRMAVEYALRGATSFQMHTLFQLPAEQYRRADGSRTQRALHELYFHPDRGLIPWLHHVARRLDLPTAPLRFRDIAAHGPRLLAPNASQHPAAR
ncbi:MAG: hypothetical protein ACKV0T_12785 [Planctomycetales bacterium]